MSADAPVRRGGGGIYIERERERERTRAREIHIVYIYIHTYTHIYIPICVAFPCPQMRRLEEEEGGEEAQAAKVTQNSRLIRIDALVPQRVDSIAETSSRAPANGGQGQVYL